MKNDRRYLTCQHAGTSSTSDTHRLHPTRPPSAPVSLSVASATTDMGLQPLTHATSRLPHLAPCSPPGADHNSYCECVVKPQERTILHGILTGQGHKFGYGGESCVSSLFTDSNGLDNDDHGLCVNLQALDNHTMALSREVTTPSRYTTPPLGK